MNIRLASIPTYDSVVDGPGIRTVIWTQGCPHDCKGCHNPGTHNYNGGFLYDVDTLISEISIPKNNVTFSGGDPFVQPKQCAYIAKILKEKGLNIWAYSGWTYETLLEKSKKDKNIMEFLKNIDFLVDSPFILEKRTLNLPYRGSSNQRIINVQESLKTGITIINNSFGEELKEPTFDGIFI